VDDLRFNLSDADDLILLTRNERHVLDAFASGQTRAEIAIALQLSPSTVSHILTSAKEKLGAPSPPVAAVRYQYALQAKLAAESRVNPKSRGGA
jgi:DNA-binding CsgD family transcriptional regulator